MKPIEEAPVPLPTVQLAGLGPGISLLQPLSRRGHGPGLVVLTASKSSTSVAIEDGIPAPPMKWAEEGYTVIELRAEAWTDGHDPISVALVGLSQCEKCQPKGQVGLVAYDPELWSKVVSSLPAHPQFVGAVVYGDAATAMSLSLLQAPIPTLWHLAGAAKKMPPARQKDFPVYHYPEAESFLFASPFQNQFNYSSEGVSHTRNLTFLKGRMDGPYFDLEAIWEEHTHYEFEARSVPHTMATMVQEPYVNHIPTLTGGIGRDRLSDFYQHHFVFQNPEDMQMELISRTVGIDRVIDEFICKFTHDMQIDWLLPGIPATGLKVEIPFTAVVNIRGDRLYHEHIAWDQTTALIQLGLLPEYLPYPHRMPDGRTPGPGKKFEYRVPGSGREAAQKMKDKNGVPSNQMFSYQVREVDI